jgi:hypothetical protein
MRELAIRASWRCDLDDLSSLASVGPSDASSEDSRAAQIATPIAAPIKRASITTYVTRPMSSGPACTADTPASIATGSLHGCRRRDTSSKGPIRALRCRAALVCWLFAGRAGVSTSTVPTSKRRADDRLQTASLASACCF